VIGKTGLSVRTLSYIHSNTLTPIPPLPNNRLQLPSAVTITQSHSYSFGWPRLSSSCPLSRKGEHPLWLHPSLFYIIFLISYLRDHITLPLHFLLCLYKPLMLSNLFSDTIKQSHSDALTGLSCPRPVLYIFPEGEASYLAPTPTLPFLILPFMKSPI
jgi:hypothetical protein